MGHLYYLIGLFILFGLFSYIINIRKYNKVKIWYSKYEEVTKSKPLKKDFRSKEDYSLYETLSKFTIFEFIWVVLGILTSSWYVYLFIITISMIINQSLRKVSIQSISNGVSFILSIFKFSVYLYLIINHFHLHYNTWEIVQKVI
jgi:hypothetical protein